MDWTKEERSSKMNLGVFILALASLVSGLMRPKEPSDPVLFVGQPCSCMSSIHADVPQGDVTLLKLLAEREYRWVVVFEPLENRQALAGYLLRTQPQAEILLMEDPELAAKYRINYAPDCCTVLEMLEKDREKGWKSGF